MSKERYRKCDICGRRLDGDFSFDKRYKFSKIIFWMIDPCDDNIPRVKDMCSSCFKRFKRFVKEEMEEEANAESTD